MGGRRPNVQNAPTNGAPLAEERQHHPLRQVMVPPVEPDEVPPGLTRRHIIMNGHVVVMAEHRRPTDSEDGVASSNEGNDPKRSNEHVDDQDLNDDHLEEDEQANGQNASSSSAALLPTTNNAVSTNSQSATSAPRPHADGEYWSDEEKLRLCLDKRAFPDSYKKAGQEHLHLTMEEFEARHNQWRADNGYATDRTNNAIRNRVSIWTKKKSLARLIRELETALGLPLTSGRDLPIITAARTAPAAPPAPLPSTRAPRLIVRLPMSHPTPVPPPTTKTRGVKRKSTSEGTSLNAQGVADDDEEEPMASRSARRRQRRRLLRRQEELSDTDEDTEDK